MKHWLALALVVSSLMGCGETGAPKTSSAPAETPPVPPGGARTVMEAQTNLYLYDTDATGGNEQKPRFAVQDAVVSMDENNAWSFKNAHAIIYGHDGTETFLDAGEGFLDQKGQRAHLKGGVTMRSGTMEIQLEDIEWNNEERKAISVHPITLRDGGSELTATSLEYDPDAKKLTLTNIRGTIRYERSATQ